MNWIHTASGRTVGELGGFKVIYADPPWSYRQGGRGAAENHYRTMPHAAICALPVRDLAGPNCALFMWGTYPNTPEAMDVIESWGFEFKTLAFQWVKTNSKAASAFWGGGSYSRANTEPCWLATRGKVEVISHSVHQLILTCGHADETILAPVGEHSAKPQEARDRILKLCGDVPAVELFARDRDPRFEVWGNEVSQTIELR